jgi:hypothetical protein
MAIIYVIRSNLIIHNKVQKDSIPSFQIIGSYHIKYKIRYLIFI